MSQSLIDGDPFGSIQHQNSVEEIFELVDFPQLIFGHLLVADQFHAQITTDSYRTHNDNFFLKQTDKK